MIVNKINGKIEVAHLWPGEEVAVRSAHQPSIIVGLDLNGSPFIKVDWEGTSRPIRVVDENDDDIVTLRLPS